jgi:hypothetical protein
MIRIPKGATEEVSRHVSSGLSFGDDMMNVQRLNIDILHHLHLQFCEKTLSNIVSTNAFRKFNGSGRTSDQPRLCGLTSPPFFVSASPFFVFSPVIMCFLDIRHCVLSSYLPLCVFFISAITCLHLSHYLCLPPLSNYQISLLLRLNIQSSCS